MYRRWHLLRFAHSVLRLWANLSDSRRGLISRRNSILRRWRITLLWGHAEIPFVYKVSLVISGPNDGTGNREGNSLNQRASHFFGASLPMPIGAITMTMAHTMTTMATTMTIAIRRVRRRRWFRALSLVLIDGKDLCRSECRPGRGRGKFREEEDYFSVDSKIPLRAVVCDFTALADTSGFFPSYDVSS